MFDWVLNTFLEMFANSQILFLEFANEKEQIWYKVLLNFA